MAKFEEIKNLIESGFDDEELIAFELDVPIEQVRQCRMELKANALGEDFNEEDYKAHLKMQGMRDRFRVLLCGEKKKEEKGESEAISFSQIESIRARVEKTKGKERKRIIALLAEAIQDKQRECTDIQELQYLLKMLTADIVKDGPIFVDGTKSVIYRRIANLQQQQAIERLRNDIPESIAAIISDLANGTIDMEDAKRVIGKEVERKMATNPKTKFALSEDARRRQILQQISMSIVEKAERYPIQQPEVTMVQLQELLGIGEEEAIKKVVRNCIARKDYQAARGVLDKNDIKNEYGYTVRSIASLRDEINNAEFGDIILKGMNKARTHQEERAYIEMIQKAVDSGRVRMGAVPLGKSVDGLRNITLADVWEDGKTKKAACK